MNKLYALAVIFSFLCFSVTVTGQPTHQHSEELYSRNLSRFVQLTIIDPQPGFANNRTNLLLLNDGQDMDKFRVKAIIDSLSVKKMIGQVLVVGIHASDRLKEYGVAGMSDYLGRGDLSAAYQAFIAEELYPYLKKTPVVQRFNSIVIAGCSLGGLAAFDMAWGHPNLINKVGVFSGSFWWRDKDDKDPSYTDEKDRIMLNKVRTSGKRKRLPCWFYAGAKEESSDRDNDGIIDVIDDTRDLIKLIKSKCPASQSEIKYTEDLEGLHDYPWWSRQLAGFLLWAFGK